MSLSGHIFGWVLVGNENIPIAHHVGIILNWNDKDPWKSIVAHYGALCQGKVYVDYLLDAAIRSEISVVRINPHFHMNDSSRLYSIKQNKLYPSDELVEYEYKHPVYDIWKSNCQHFVRHFIPDIPLEIDFLPSVPAIFQTLISKSIFSSSDDLGHTMNNIVNVYNDHRNDGIAKWHQDLDMYVPDKYIKHISS